MARASEILGASKALVGMVHLQALPGTPRNNGNSVQQTAERAVREASMLAEAGFDALILENMHDVPYLRREVGPEIVAAMTHVADRVRQAIGLPLGVQVLAGANRAAVAVAHAAGLDFIRAEGFVYAAVADEGLLDEADAGHLLRYRKMIGAERVKILADVKKKHSSHAITSDIELAEFARAAAFFHADGVIVTGAATARPTSVEDVRVVRTATDLPLAVGSGVTPENARDLLAYADALIVGSWYKTRGQWQNDPDPQRVKDLVKAVERARM
jgi:hypothetical protein